MIRGWVVLLAGVWWLYANTWIEARARESGLGITRQRLAEAKPVTIVCFGDSITGVYYHTGGRRAYPEILELALRQAYPGAKVEVINAGISGHTTREALARIDRDVLRHKPHLVTVMFGMNDMVRVPLEEFRKNLATIEARCKAAGAEVLFCTQNNLIETGARPGKKLAEVTRIIREVARERGVGLADCHSAYEAARKKDANDWRLLLSDAIHPNMDGHRLLAQTLAGAIVGKEFALAPIGPPQPALVRTKRLLKAGEPIRVLAMPPYDRVIGPALHAVDPKARVEVTPWPTEGKTLPELEVAARKVRGMKTDLVIVAIPAGATAPNTESRIHAYSWVLNNSLSFGRQEWDVIAIPPSTAKGKLDPTEEGQDKFARRLIAAQDLNMITRWPGEAGAELRRVVTRWVKEQMGEK